MASDRVNNKGITAYLVEQVKLRGPLSLLQMRQALDNAGYRYSPDALRASLGKRKDLWLRYPPTVQGERSRYSVQPTADLSKLRD